MEEKNPYIVRVQVDLKDRRFRVAFLRNSSYRNRSLSKISAFMPLLAQKNFFCPYSCAQCLHLLTPRIARHHYYHKLLPNERGRPRRAFRGGRGTRPTRLARRREASIKRQYEVIIVNIRDSGGLQKNADQKRRNAKTEEYPKE